MAVALIKMFAFQFGYGYIADDIAEYFSYQYAVKKCLSIFAGEFEKITSFWKVFIDKCIRLEENLAMFTPVVLKNAFHVPRYGASSNLSKNET